MWCLSDCIRNWIKLEIKDRSSGKPSNLACIGSIVSPTDVLHLNYQQPVGGAPTFRSVNGGNKPGTVNHPQYVSCLSRRMRSQKLTLIDHGTVFVDKPFVSRSSNASDWETVYGVEHEEDEWEISITNFSLPEFDILLVLSIHLRPCIHSGPPWQGA